MSSSATLRLLDEVKGLRKQLQRGIRNNDALAQQLRSKLELQSEREEEEEEEGDGEGSRSSGSQVDGGGSVGGRRPRHVTGYSGHMTSTTAVGPSSTASGPIPRSTHLPPPHETRIPLGGGLGTLTVRADVKMTSDGSASSLPQLSLSGRTPHRDDPSLLLSAPRSHSSPFVKGAGLRMSSHAPSASSRFPRTSEEEGKLGVRDASTGTHRHTADSTSHSFGDYITREGIPKLEPAVHPSYPTPAASLGRGHPPPPTTSSHLPLSSSHPPSSTHTPPPTPRPSTDGRRKRREFESFESRLKQALESSQVRIPLHIPFTDDPIQTSG